MDSTIIIAAIVAVGLMIGNFAKLLEAGAKASAEVRAWLRR